MFDLKQEFEKRYDPMLREAEELKVRLADLASDTSFKLDLRQLEAKLKVIDGEIIRLTSDGDFEGADKKEAEKRGIAGHLHNLRSERNQEIDRLQNRISFIASERENIANEILREGWPLIQKEAWLRLEEAIDFVDSVWERVENFRRETGAHGGGCGCSQSQSFPKHGSWFISENFEVGPYAVGGEMMKKMLSAI